MDQSVGRERRLQRLLCGGDQLHLLALDHGLTMGWTDSQDPPIVIGRAAAEAGLNGVVVHPGLLRELGSATGMELLLQLHGSPSPGEPKTQVSTPEMALASDCVGVAVEFSASGSSDQLRGLGALIAEARNAGLLVLVMATYAGETNRAAARAVAGAHQLGADLIKVRVPGSLDDGFELFRKVVSSAPPVLAAGNDTSRCLGSTLKLARDAGFSGTCVGRHYFDSALRPGALEQVTGHGLSVRRLHT